MATRPDLLAQHAARTMSSVRTGIVLLILVGIASAAGTLVLQRPLTDPEDLARAYSPETLPWLDRLGLTDVFHSWWFLLLLTLLSINIILASLERFPQAWRYFARPYRRPERHFLSALPLQEEIEIADSAQGVRAAEQAFRRTGLEPQRIGAGAEFSLFAERHRFARLAAYVVHTSLLLILAGGIVDGLWGYRGFVALRQGEQSGEIELRDGTKQTLPFTVRCDSAGQENYPDGSPRRWWSKLTVIENGREIRRKEIEVNEPLIHRGLRFFQASYGSTGEAGRVTLAAMRKQAPHEPREIRLALHQTLELDRETSVTFAAFIPDFVVRGREVISRSEQLNNPAIQLLVRSKNPGESKVWLFPRFPQFAHPDASPYRFEFHNLETGYYTGLQVAYEPGQWAVWTGFVLMAVGLAMAFYFVHLRVWAVPISDGRGRLVLWLGASASKNRDELTQRFERLVEEIRRQLKQKDSAAATLALARPVES